MAMCVQYSSAYCIYCLSTTHLLSTPCMYVCMYVAGDECMQLVCTVLGCTWDGYSRLVQSQGDGDRGKRAPSVS